MVKYRIKTLIFHPALAPYRVDLFNELTKFLDLKVVFLNENLVNQKFDQALLRNRLKCESDYLDPGINVSGRQIRWGIKKNITRFQPDVIVTHEFSPTSLLVSFRKKLLPVNNKWKQLIWTADNVSICGEAHFFRRRARKFSLNAADGMIVYTKAVKDWYVQYGVPEKRIGFCPNIQKEDAFRSALQDTLPISEHYVKNYNLVGKRVLLFVGRLVEVKGIDRAINAFASVAKAIPGAVFVIVGDGPDKDPLAALAASKGIDSSIKFVGRFEKEELLAWYLIGQLFILASSFEPYGAVINEALLAGMPVLCSSRAGAADLIRDGRNGNVFDPYDASTLSEQLKSMLAAISPLQEISLSIRKNLMPVSFDDATRGFVETVVNAAQEQHQK